MRDRNATGFCSRFNAGGDVDAFLDRERERYAGQLARYAMALGGEEATMLGLYFPLLAGWREWKDTKP